jgi:hypothetical protein
LCRTADDGVPPPPVGAPPAQVVPPGAKQIALQIEAHPSLLPSGRQLQVAAIDLTGLRVEIGKNRETFAFIDSFDRLICFSSKILEPLVVSRKITLSRPGSIDSR